LQFSVPIRVIKPQLGGALTAVAAAGRPRSVKTMIHPHKLIMTATEKLILPFFVLQTELGLYLTVLTKPFLIFLLGLVMIFRHLPIMMVTARLT